MQHKASNVHITPARHKHRVPLLHPSYTAECRSGPGCFRGSQKRLEHNDRACISIAQCNWEVPYFSLTQLDGTKFTIYHQGFFQSVRRNPSLNCLHRRRSLAILGHAGPGCRIRLSLHLVLGLPCRLAHSRGVHSVTRLVHLLSLNRAMCHTHQCIPFLITSMMSFTPVGDPGITFVVT